MAQHSYDSISFCHPIGGSNVLLQCIMYIVVNFTHIVVTIKSTLPINAFSIVNSAVSFTFDHKDSHIHILYCTNNYSLRNTQVKIIKIYLTT